MATIGGGLQALRLSSRAHAVPEVIPTSRTVRAPALPRILSPTFAQAGASMGRKILVGMALVAILGAVGASGYQFGKFLKERERAEATRQI